MSDIDLVELKDELEEWQGFYEDPADRKQYAFFTALIGAIEQLEAAQRERDELIVERTASMAEMSRYIVQDIADRKQAISKLAAAKRERDEALAELKRRDAQEPDGHIFCHPNGKLFWSVSDDSNAGRNGVRPFYFAAPAAALPPKISED